MIDGWSLQQYADQNQPIGASEDSCISVGCIWLPSSGIPKNAHDATKKILLCAASCILLRHILR